MFSKIKKFFKFITKKSIKFVAKKTVKWGFWSLVLFYGPGPIIAAVGIEGLIGAVLVSQSGIIEYTTGKAISNIIK